jgi:hydroxymethylglutaryl-CoA lyase
MIEIVECPRDAMQGLNSFIPSSEKAAYLQSLLNCNFSYLDFGSFVSERAVPQMKDTAEVLTQLNLERTKTKLLAIVANLRGAQRAAEFEAISVLGFPFSLSEIFQMRNTNRSQAEAFEEIQRIAEVVAFSGKKLVVYFSMGFGNPYGSPWSLDQISFWIDRFEGLAIDCFSLSDTMGNATPERIHEVFSYVLSTHSKYKFGAHLHARADQWEMNLDAAYTAGCRRFDGAIQGFGGCPMASDYLVGNLPTEKLISYLTTQKAAINIDVHGFEVAYNKAKNLFSKYT